MNVSQARKCAWYSPTATKTLQGHTGKSSAPISLEVDIIRTKLGFLDVQPALLLIDPYHQDRGVGEK